MSNTKNTGGAAFPIPNVDHVYDGMTLRDYFAAKVMQGLASVPDERVYRSPNEQTYEEWQADIYANDARTAYAMADAMLKAREQ